MIITKDGLDEKKIENEDDDALHDLEIMIENEGYVRILVRMIYSEWRMENTQTKTGKTFIIDKIYIIIEIKKVTKNCISCTLMNKYQSKLFKFSSKYIHFSCFNCFFKFVTIAVVICFSFSFSFLFFSLVLFVLILSFFG